MTGPKRASRIKKARIAIPTLALRFPISKRQVSRQRDEVAGVTIVGPCAGAVGATPPTMNRGSTARGATGCPAYTGCLRLLITINFLSNALADQAEYRESRPGS